MLNKKDKKTLGYTDSCGFRFPCWTDAEQPIKDNIKRVRDKIETKV